MHNRLMPKRPRYETKADKEREALVAEKFARHFEDMSVEKLADQGRADYVAYQDGEPVGYIEIKVRTCQHNQYSTYFISKKKLLALQKLAGDKKSAVVVQWTDRAGFIPVNLFLENATFRSGGRKDRNDPLDIEEMAEVDISLFRFLD